LIPSGLFIFPLTTPKSPIIRKKKKKKERKKKKTVITVLLALERKQLVSCKALGRLQLLSK
jgi:hypothetical protein